MKKQYSVLCSRIGDLGLVIYTHPSVYLEFFHGGWHTDFIRRIHCARIIMHDNIIYTLLCVNENVCHLCTKFGYSTTKQSLMQWIFFLIFKLKVQKLLK